MERVSREQLKILFRKVKKLRLPKDLEDKDFDKLKYLGWLDETDQVCYLVYKYKGELTGLRLEVLRCSHKPLQRGFCEFCHKHRKRSDILLVSAKTKKLPKGINYRSRGNYICSNFDQCNRDLKDTKEIENFFYMILEQE